MITTKEIHKAAKIRILMILSYLMLLLFILFWISERYKQERENLRTELLAEFHMSEQQVLDTLIMERMINPLLKEQWQAKDSLESFAGGRSEVKMTMIRNTSGGLESAKTITVLRDTIIGSSKPAGEAFHFIDTAGSHKNILIQTKPGEGHTDRILLQGMKLFVNIVKDSLGKDDAQVIAFAEQIDTSRLKEYFNRRIAGSRMEAVWEVADSMDSVKHQSAFVFSGNVLDDRIRIKIEQYTLYLLRKISPQIGFGLFLLVLTGTAFFISFRSLKQQYLLNEIRNDFVANITHELKTPVSTVKVALEALQKYSEANDPDRTREYLAMASNEAERLEQLVQKVLSSSFQQQTVNILNRQEMDLSSLLRMVLRSMEGRFKKEGAEVSFDCKEGNYNLRADYMHLQSVFLNLLDNALKYTPAPAKINLRLSIKDDTLVADITDNGPGIPAEYQSRVFDKFFRIPAENIHNVKGYGLGLSYASMIVKAHRGNIRVFNNPEGGCTFSILLPALTVR
ncbi:MAG: HAMP domain-containing sensor histidine kinase [Bacteroidales bacterium]